MQPATEELEAVRAARQYIIAHNRGCECNVRWMLLVTYVEGTFFQFDEACIAYSYSSSSLPMFVVLSLLLL